MTFEFVAGNLALDFVATVAERRTTAEERLPTAGDLAQWFVDAGVVDAPPAVDETAYRLALQLRESIWGLLTTDADRPLDESAVADLNRQAASPVPVASLDADRRVTTEGDLPACLAAVARAAIDAFRPENARHLKWCEGTDCTRPFLDASRASNRRWCGMAGCGDRAKAAAYRARKRATPPLPTPQQSLPR
ncbi:CGNR zinc finger domain-containing protein [Leifsonia sp. RAF41]|uniref:CGNR zinc finger domain-containing protein n=1 Tax=Leifsonia sp. RAF41 TaxID=3233056 RepID=UPI003F996AC2